MKISQLDKIWYYTIHQLPKNTLQESADREQSGFVLGKQHNSTYIKCCGVLVVMAGWVLQRSAVGGSNCHVTKTPEEDMVPGVFVGDECSSPMQLAGQGGLVRWWVGLVRGSRRCLRLVVVSFFPVLFSSLRPFLATSSPFLVMFSSSL